MATSRTTPLLPARWAWALGIGAGAAVWLGIGRLGGKAEAWDAGLYFAAGVPILAATAALLGAAHPARAWRWGVSVILPQPALLVADSGVGVFLPSGILLFALLAGLCALAAGGASRWRRLRGRDVRDGEGANPPAASCTPPERG